MQGQKTPNFHRDMVNKTKLSLFDTLIVTVVVFEVASGFNFN